MTFAHPLALWLLTLAVPIIAVHFYRGRVRRLSVPTLHFWEQVLVEEQRTTALKKLRHYATLILSLIALSILTSALADPTVRGVTPETLEVALVIDTAPEMAAREADGRVRLDIARDGAKALIAGLYRRSTCALYDAGGLVEPATLDRDRLLRQLGRLPREVVPGEIAEIAASARAAQPRALIYVWSARSFAPPDGGTRVIPAGAPRPNRALRAPVQEGATLFAVAANDWSEAIDATLVIRNRGRVIAEEPLKLAARESRRISRLLDAKAFPNERFDEGAFIEMSIVPDDAYPRDDAVHFILPSPHAPPVVVVSAKAPDPHLWSAIRLIEPRAVAITPERFTEAYEKLGAVAVYVFDGVDPPEDLDGGWLLVACGPQGAEVANPRLLEWDRRAAVHELVDYGNVTLRRARLLKGDPLVVSDRGPVAVWGRRMGRAWIQSGFGFGVADGDFALKPSFPIFLRNAIAWLADAGRRAFPRTATVGAVVSNSCPLPPNVADVRVTTVSGISSQETIVSVERGEARLRVAQPGLVKLTVAGKSEWMAVRLASSPDLVRLPKEEGVALPEAVSGWRALPFPAVAGALVVLILLVEWVLYQVRA